MLSDEQISAQLPHVLNVTKYDFLGQRHQGKVRDSYTRGKIRILIATDRLSCFDRVVTTVPFKGEVLNTLAVHWFTLSKDIIENHILDIPDPNVIVANECAIIPIEVVVRAYLAGSAWRDYSSGRAVSGIVLPPGLRKHGKLPQPLLTPSTKAEIGKHDEPIGEQEILARGLVSALLWGQIRDTALALFGLGQKEAAKNGLILVDTKYEFGMYEGRLVLADEIHTLDSSRYWVADTYTEKLADNETPEMLDKEPTRQWLLEQGFKGDGPIPTFTDEHRIDIARHYISAFERIAGRPFVSSVGPVSERIEKNLESYLEGAR
ncbi:MAG: phosphoribosylaminoimidazolesuccinocarboxamide synthase [Deltaproteobacteria bacterium]|nr:phosphoribosylaminoimidazolesuccinocarboxamide synthase [Deltaproteobacteria bacterium]